ncbi:MAG TPA: hypothetical protein VJK08_00140 [Patescibacteria group bacterium]|nr:hypothetical protein [Patescibacteria group bacterium]
MKTEEIKDYIASVKWQFAKTMSAIPHEYTVAEWNPGKKDLFETFILCIRENGYKNVFYGKEYMYFDVDGYKYWTMGNPLEETTLINRAKLDSEKKVEA